MAPLADETEPIEQRVTARLELGFDLLARAEDLAPLGLEELQEALLALDEGLPNPDLPALENLEGALHDLDLLDLRRQRANEPRRGEGPPAEAPGVASTCPSSFGFVPSSHGDSFRVTAS